MVSKEDYSSFEKNIIKDLFITNQKSEVRVPKNDKPVYAIKKKVIIVLDYYIQNQKISDLVLSNNNNLPLPKKEYIKLYHIGNKKYDNVSIGLSNSIFTFPAIDLGGLTNYKQSLGQKAEFIGKGLNITNSFSQKEMDSIYTLWKKYSGKKMFYGNVKKELKKVLSGVLSYYPSVHISFVKVPEEYRVIYSSKYIQEKYLKYYLRLFNGTDYAKEVKGDNKLFCGITDKYITPNLNINNIRNEYSII
jgi:hypothetical protein